MKLIKILLTQSLFIIICYLPASAQTDASVLTQIMTKTAKLYNNYPIEKVYLHFDKPYYAVGDTIWFKAYLTLDHHQPSVLSKIIYVDMVGPHDSVVTSLKLQVKNSVAWASIALSQYNYKKGNYHIVAYTNWMNNAGAAYFFNKNITIGNAINNDLYTQVSLKSAVINKQTRVTAGIYFKDIDGSPYANKKVSWSAQKEDESIAKGKGETDKNGFLSVSFINLKNTHLDTATLSAVIDDGNKKMMGSTFPLKSIAHANDIQFFPEGGELLVSVPSKVAFKALKSDGLGIDVKGTITDNTNKTVAEFTSSHLGMGSFEFTPEDGKTYKATVSYADGSTATPELPKIQTGGMNLSLENSNPNNLALQIQADASFFKEFKDKTFYIIGKSSGIICFAGKTVLTNSIYSAIIPKSKFPTGIVQVTVFTDDGDPISERIAFIQHNDQLNLAISSDHPSYTTRQKVKLNITAKNNDQPDEGNFSVTVLDESKVPYDENAETTILTNLLLTSDIKGYIEKPNYYFNHPDPKAVTDLDILMRTQGYRRFSYDGILNDKYPPIRDLPEQGIDITGTLRASNGMAMKNNTIRLLIPDKNYSVNAVTNIDGKYKFSNLVFLDSAKVNISARNNEHASDLILSTDGDLSSPAIVNNNKADETLNIDSTLNSYLKNSRVRYNDLHILKEVVIKDKRIVPTTSHRDYGNLSSLGFEADHVLTGDWIKNCPNLLECLKTGAIGMMFDQNNFYITRDYNAGNKKPVQVFLKGMPVDVNALETINGNEVESVEIFLKDELGLVNSANNSNGAIVVNMRKIETTKISLQQLRDMIPPKNEITMYPKGYSLVRTFYLPRYSGPRESQTIQTDTRSTIYWNPNVTTDKTGTASVEFFNADGKGTYRAIIEGFDKDGNLGRQVYRYTVK
jgi:hypothetical protein